MDTNTLERFPYIWENLIQYAPDIVGMILGLFLLCALFWGSYYFFLYSRWYFILRKEQKQLAKKKWVLSDLILMKDIQTELEKEIEQAMLKSTFQ